MSEPTSPGEHPPVEPGPLGSRPGAVTVRDVTVVLLRVLAGVVAFGLAGGFLAGMAQSIGYEASDPYARAIYVWAEERTPGDLEVFEYYSDRERFPYMAAEVPHDLRAQLPGPAAAGGSTDWSVLPEVSFSLPAHAAAALLLAFSFGRMHPKWTVFFGVLILLVAAVGLAGYYLVNNGMYPQFVYSIAELRAGLPAAVAAFAIGGAMWLGCVALTAWARVRRWRPAADRRAGRPT